MPSEDRPHSEARNWRSLLFVPADNPSRIAKAARSDADAVILDLEDGVAHPAKAEARAGLSRAAAILRAGGKAVIVRVNAPWLIAIEDLAAVISAQIDVIMLPKVETATRVTVMGDIMAEYETLSGRQLGQMSIVALIESARGLATASNVADHERVIALALGSEDFSLDMGMDPTMQSLDLPCRQLVLGGAARGIATFAMPFSIADFADEMGIETAARAARGYGAAGALCVHPTQVRIANDIFSPTKSELKFAREVAEAWKSAEKDGIVVLNVGGRMVDAPVAARAATLLARDEMRTRAAQSPEPKS